MLQWHADSDIYGQDKFDPAKKWYPSPLYMMGMLFGTVFGLFGVMKLLKPYPIHRPVVCIYLAAPLVSHIYGATLLVPYFSILYFGILFLL